MSSGQIILLSFVFVFFGTLSGIYTAISLRLIWKWLQDKGFVVQLEFPAIDRHRLNSPEQPPKF